MEPAPTQGSGALKPLAAVTLAQLGLVDLGMSLCGGFFAGFA